MNFQVFGCPSCEQPFQVSAEQAGQVVQCPSCAQQVEIPQEAFGNPKLTSDASAEPHQVFACPNCRGQFGITPEMLGQQVGCPHCQSSILIETPEPDLESLPPQIITDRPIIKTKSRKKPAPKSASPDPEALKDLFAPGFKAKSKPAKPELPNAKAEKAPPVVSGSPKTATQPGSPKKPVQPGSPKKRIQPSSPSSDKGQGTAKDKQRWRSPKKRSTKTKPPATETPASQPAARRPDAVPPNVEKAGSPKTPAPPADPKTKQPKPQRPVELSEHPDEFPVNRASATRTDIAIAGVVEIVESQMPTAEQPARKTEKPIAQVDVSPVPPVQNRQVESAEPDASDKAGDENVEENVIAAQVVAPVISEPEVDEDQPEPIDHLLPPRFDVLDPTQMAIKSSKNQFKVLLPDGKGGMAEVDQRIVRVEHEGERVSLVKMTPEQKARRRLIQNIIAIIIGIAMMGFAFWMLK